VSGDWVKQSVAPHVPMPFTLEGGRFYYGFTWWLYPVSGKYAWMASGVGGQTLLVFPQEDLIAVFTGWDLLNEPDTPPLVRRLFSAVKATSYQNCTNKVAEPHRVVQKMSVVIKR
jgi:hypothetical protein